MKADQADEEEDKVALPPGLCTRARRHESSRPHARTDVMSVRVGVEGARARVGGFAGRACWLCCSTPVALARW